MGSIVGPSQAKAATSGPRRGKIQAFKTFGSQFPVVSNAHSKTLDAGCDGRTFSCNPVGDILQMTCYHPVHGMVLACPFAQFDGTQYHNPEYVRDYRKKLLDYVRSGTRGFGVRFDGEISKCHASFLDNQWIVVNYSVGLVDVSTTISINQEEVEQFVTLKTSSLTPVRLNYSLDLGISVNRASYGQLTEGGPIPIPDSRNEFRIFDSGYRWAIVNDNLDAVVEGSLSYNEHAVQIGTGMIDELFVGKPANKNFQASVEVAHGNPCSLKSSFRLRPQGAASPSSQQPLAKVASRGQWRLANDEFGVIIRRNLEYIVGNCTLPVGKDTVCFITDHVALPLGWNRDNYWQIRFLLDVHSQLDEIAYPTTASVYANQIRDSVRGHLNWVFNMAQRPHGYWHRSYLANGVPKDGPVFQQDQQCYPLLELCDFYDQFPSEREFVEIIMGGQAIPLILEMLEEHRDLATGLYPTDETPGDDAVEHPFHFSSHILLWHTLIQLSSLVKRFPTCQQPQYSSLDSKADMLRETIMKHFVSPNPQTGQTMFAYLTDGAGQHTFYHDANDIPTLFAQDWNFIDSTSYGVWTRTMDFALSPLNVGGFYPDGEFGGLGSVHTRGPWPLGYAQELIYANIMGNDAAKEDAWRRIKGSMFWDGLFPEAVDCNTGDCVSKAWFSWPGSMIGSALLRFNVKPSTKSTL